MVDILVPKTIDEVKAEEENDSLNENKMVDVQDQENHEQHIAIHYMAKKTWATWTHIAWHEELLGLIKAQEKQQQMQAQQPDEGKPKDAGKPKVGKEKKDPQAQASPLKSEIKPKMSVK